MCILAIFSIIALALDHGSNFVTKSKMQQALDIGVSVTSQDLAKGNVFSAAKDRGKAFFDINFLSNESYSLIIERDTNNSVVGRVDVLKSQSFAKVNGNNTVDIVNVAVTGIDWLDSMPVEIVFAIDVSSSMSELDASGNTRIDSAKNSILTALNQLPVRNNIYVSIIPFSSNVRVAGHADAAYKAHINSYIQPMTPNWGGCIMEPNDNSDLSLKAPETTIRRMRQHPGLARRFAGHDVLRDNVSIPGSSTVIQQWPLPLGGQPYMDNSIGSFYNAIGCTAQANANAAANPAMKYTCECTRVPPSPICLDYGTHDTGVCLNYSEATYIGEGKYLQPYCLTWENPTTICKVRSPDYCSTVNLIEYTQAVYKKIYARGWAHAGDAWTCNATAGPAPILTFKSIGTERSVIDAYINNLTPISRVMFSGIDLDTPYAAGKNFTEGSLPHLGLLWGARALNDDWTDFWNYTHRSADPQKTSRKFLILLTDGEPVTTNPVLVPDRYEFDIPKLLDHGMRASLTDRLYGGSFATLPFGGNYTKGELLSLPITHYITKTGFTANQRLYAPLPGTIYDVMPYQNTVLGYEMYRLQDDASGNPVLSNVGGHLDYNPVKYDSVYEFGLTKAQAYRKFAAICEIVNSHKNINIATVRYHDDGPYGFVGVTYGGFEYNPATIMNNCASNPALFFETNSGTNLNTIFQDIGADLLTAEEFRILR